MGRACLNLHLITSHSTHLEVKMKTTFAVVVALCIFGVCLVDANPRKQKKANKAAAEMCSPVIDMMSGMSVEICRYRTAHIREMMHMAKNISCFEDAKNMLLEKFNNFSTIDWDELAEDIGDMMGDFDMEDMEDMEGMEG